MSRRALANRSRISGVYGIAFCIPLQCRTEPKASHGSGERDGDTQTLAPASVHGVAAPLLRPTADYKNGKVETVSRREITNSFRPNFLACGIIVAACMSILSGDD